MPAVASQMRIVSSPLAVATCLPSGEKATLLTLSPCPSNTAPALPDGSSQTCGHSAMPSSIVASSEPSGDSASMATGVSKSFIVAFSFSVSASTHDHVLIAVGRRRSVLPSPL